METREVDLSGASLEQLEQLKRQTEAVSWSWFSAVRALVPAKGQRGA